MAFFCVVAGCRSFSFRPKRIARLRSPAPQLKAAPRCSAMAAHCRYSTTKHAPSKALASRRSAGSQKQCCSKTQLRSCSDARQHAQRSPLLENDSSEGDLLFASQEFGRPLPIERCVLAGYQRCPRPSLMGVWTPFYVYLLGVWTPFYFYLLGVSRPSSLLLIRCPDTLLCPVSRKEGF